tara:strand:- start:89 stop:610 length:522 start_codon:yes stop_codon:yes gene_type:complete
MSNKDEHESDLVQLLVTIGIVVGIIYAILESVLRITTFFPIKQRKYETTNTTSEITSQTTPEDPFKDPNTKRFIIMFFALLFVFVFLPNVIGRMLGFPEKYFLCDVQGTFIKRRARDRPICRNQTDMDIFKSIRAFLFIVLITIIIIFGHVLNFVSRLTSNKDEKIENTLHSN